MVRLRAETASEQGGSLTLCPSLRSLFPTEAFCILFLALSETGMVKVCSPPPHTHTHSCSSLWVYCSLNARMLEIIWLGKCGPIGNPLEGRCSGTLSVPPVLCPCQ